MFLTVFIPACELHLSNRVLTNEANFICSVAAQR
jgi:hypothetical protein